MKFDSVAKVRCDYAIETFQKKTDFNRKEKLADAFCIGAKKISKKICD
jgi:hypothetical protein